MHCECFPERITNKNTIKMKTKIFALFLAVAGLFMFSSCEKEVSTLYKFKVDTLNVVEDGGAAYKTHEYLTSPRYLDWEESEYIDNDAMTSDKAAQQNDDEAIREFTENFSRFNLSSLYRYYGQQGVQLATGYFTYTLTREDGQVLRSERVDVSYPIR